VEQIWCQADDKHGQLVKAAAHALYCHDLLGLVEDVGKVAATAVLAVVHGSHEDTGTAL
jgi:hypothetical protein